MLETRKKRREIEASPTAFLMWPSARPHESFMRQSLSTLLLLLLLLPLRRCLVGTAGSPFQDPFVPPPPSNPANATWRVISQQNLSIRTVFPGYRQLSLLSILLILPLILFRRLFSRFTYSRELGILGWLYYWTGREFERDFFTAR